MSSELFNACGLGICRNPVFCQGTVPPATHSNETERTGHDLPVLLSTTTVPWFLLFRSLATGVH